MTRNTATAVNAGSVPTHLSAPTCDVSIERSEDCRSTGDFALRLFPRPRPGAVVPVPQDALLWTFRSPELIGRQAARPTALGVCHSCIQSRSCLATGERGLVEFARSVALSTQLSCHSRFGNHHAVRSCAVGMVPTPQSRQPRPRGRGISLRT